MTQVVVGAKKTKALQRELGLPPLPSLFYSLPSPNTDSVNATNTKENPWYRSRLSVLISHCLQIYSLNYLGSLQLNHNMICHFQNSVGGLICVLIILYHNYSQTSRLISSQTLVLVWPWHTEKHLWNLQFILAFENLNYW